MEHFSHFFVLKIVLFEKVSNQWKEPIKNTFSFEKDT